MATTVKNVVLFSGGMDSTVLLNEVKNDYGGDILALIFDYRSRHNAAERHFAKITCGKMGIPYQVIHIGKLFSQCKSSLTNPKIKVPHCHYEHKTARWTVVPFRNGIMLSIAVGIAEDLGAKRVFIGNHAGDHAVYLDCRNSFIRKFKEAVLEATEEEIQVASPFINIKKTDILKIGHDAGVNFEDTYSCYEGGFIHCGLCPTCYERREAFFLNKIDDPTKYKDTKPFEEIKKQYEN